MNTLPTQLKRLIDLDSLQIHTVALNDKQKDLAHLISPEFFPQGKNPFRVGKTPADYRYITEIDLSEEAFYLHPFMDPLVLEQGNVRRFPSGVNEKYISEKYFEDKWVSAGNNALAQKIEEYLQSHKDRLARQKEIHLVDIGPCGGAITTLFALRALDRMGWLSKTKVSLVDIVPNVLEATLLGRFAVPEEMIREFDLGFAGPNGEVYKQFMAQGVMRGVKEWYRDAKNPKNEMTDAAQRVADQQEGQNGPVTYYRSDGEDLPAELFGQADLVLAAYVHHHMNLIGRKRLCQHMEQTARPGGMIGVVDFYVPTFSDYKQWYVPHFQQYGDAPPVECPLFSGEILKPFFTKIQFELMQTNLQNSYLLYGVKQSPKFV